MKFVLAALSGALALSCAAPLAALAAEAGEASSRSGEPEVRHAVIEGESTRIDELRVRGVTQRIVVTTKGERPLRYEILTGDGSRDLSDGVNTSRGAAGKRVWRVLDF